MLLIEVIKNDQLEARKTGQKGRASLLTTLYSEAAIVGFNDQKRDSTDEEVVAVIKKFIKNLNECIDKCSEDMKHIYQDEKTILEAYLPKQITGEDLRTILLNYVEQNGGTKDKSTIMRNLKSQFAGRYDGKEAATMFDEI